MRSHLIFTWQAIDSPAVYAKDSNEHIFMEVCDMIINVIFTTEMVLRCIWMNFYMHPNAYLQVWQHLRNA